MSPRSSARAAPWRLLPALLLLSCNAAWAQDLELHATLRGANVVSATESPGSGEAHAWLSPDGRVRIALAFGRLESEATAAGLYAGPATENGKLVAEFDLPPGQVRARLDDIAVSLTPDVADRMRAGETYVQVETVRHSDGAIRGQLLPQPVRLDDGVEPEEND